MSQLDTHDMSELLVGSGEGNGRPELALVAEPVIVETDGPAVVVHLPRGPSLVHRPSLYERFLKPMIDRAAASVALFLLAIPIGLIALGVRLRLGSPVLFRQVRVGRAGETFTVLKFRTMHPCRRIDDGDFDGADRRINHKRADDPRLTRYGRLLRTFSLDELPQLVNVARGEMSLVGPRPELPNVVEAYEPWQYQRLMVRPGLTGFWQTKARNAGPMHENTQFDVDYVNELSLATDVKILSSTLPAILGEQRGH